LFLLAQTTKIISMMKQLWRAGKRAVESTEFGKSVIRCMRKWWTRAEKRAMESRVEWKNCEIRQCLGDDASTC
jgi:hypothetical protein